MNIFSYLGLLTTAIILVGSLWMASPKLQIFVDNPSFFIVLGGTLASAAIAVQFNNLFKIFAFVGRDFLGGKSILFKNTIKDIMTISEGFRSGNSLESLVANAKDPFLKEAVQILADGVLDKEQVLSVLESRANNMSLTRFDDVKVVKGLSKYPPAYGMMGTVIGMVVLLANLNGADAIKMVGPAMAVCLLTTLYGLIFSNMFIIPVAEYLETASGRYDKKDEIIIEGVKHIIKKSNPILIAEDLNSYLKPNERVDWKALVSK